MGVIEQAASGVEPRGVASAERRAQLARPRSRGWVMRRLLLVADVVGLLAAFLTAVVMYGSYGEGDHVTAQAELILFFLSLPLWVLLAKLHGLYERDEERADHSTVDDIVGVVQMVTIGAWLFLIVATGTSLADPDLLKLGTFWGLAIAFVTAARAGVRALCRQSVFYVQNTIIVGAGEIGQLIARKLLKHPEYGLNLVGFVDDDPKARRGDLEHLTVLGRPERLRELIELLDVERVVVAFSNDREEETLALVRSLSDIDVQIDVVPRLFDLVGPRVEIHTVEGFPLVGLPPARLTPSSRLIKRALDIAVASLMLVLTAPLFAFIALRVKFDSPGPVLFRQPRLGLNMAQFTALKFRTMKVDTDDAVHRAYIGRVAKNGAPANQNGLFKLERADAVTRPGSWLRRTSLDELPQLVNVLRGEMSLVGPRPCIAYETEHFEDHHFDRFLVPAGITGLWQVTARANSSFAEALDMDVAYVRGWSLGLDLRLLCRTPFQLLRQRAATT